MWTLKFSLLLLACVVQTFGRAPYQSESNYYSHNDANGGYNDNKDAAENKHTYAYDNAGKDNSKQHNTNYGAVNDYEVNKQKQKKQFEGFLLFIHNPEITSEFLEFLNAHQGYSKWKWVEQRVEPKVRYHQPKLNAIKQSIPLRNKKYAYDDVDEDNNDDDNAQGYQADNDAYQSKYNGKSHYY